MVVPSLLSAIHLLTLALGLGGVFVRGRALAGPLDDVGWRRLLAADDLWGLAALLWLTSGFGRVFFGAIFILELAPMTTFIRARMARRRGAPPPQFPVQRYRRINAIEVVLVVTIVFVAPFMARGAWLF